MYLLVYLTKEGGRVVIRKSGGCFHTHCWNNLSYWPSCNLLQHIWYLTQGITTRYCLVEGKHFTCCLNAVRCCCPLRFTIVIEMCLDFKFVHSAITNLRYLVFQPLYFLISEWRWIHACRLKLSTKVYGWLAHSGSDPVWPSIFTLVAIWAC